MAKKHLTFIVEVLGLIALSSCVFTAGSSNSTTSSPSDSSSASSSSSSSSEENSSVAYRIAPVVASGSEEEVPVYNVTANNGDYSGTEVTTIKRNQDCLDYQSVCLYYEAFRTFPPNYKETRSEALSYGTKGRLVSTYDKSESHSNDYTLTFGTFNRPDDGVYYEFDIDLTGNYNTGSTLNRGAGRVVVVKDGLTDYGSEPVCFYTSDHYADFNEFYNYDSGWSVLFRGVENSSGSYHNVPISDLSRPIPTTVTYHIA